ncbi:hypothetical protein MEQU1_002175 [Malassezia equina]|uniref:triacylglycerol lipase n=1 Tax=Malassezia equina TaxID=1381935 RepID=A0AAF0IZ02_9BASI|nr:hypothetical protein MEQU1_002175 [Malassezia equina]
MRIWTLALLRISLAMSAVGLAIRSDPIVPQDKPLGHIYRWREVNVTAIFDFNVAKAYQLLYRTSYVNESDATTSVTTILVPHNAQKDKLVACGDWQDAKDPTCAPSYALQKGLFGPDTSIILNYALMLPLLQAGYPVAIPDKQGPATATSKHSLVYLVDIKPSREYEIIHINVLNLGLHAKNIT